MNRIKISESTRALLCSVAVLASVVITATLVANYRTVEANSANSAAVVTPSAVFPANAGTLGAIPDGAAGLCGSNGAARDVTFTVSGLTGTVSTVSVSSTWGSPVHTWRGDITERLISPSATNFVVFGFTGSTTAGGCGSSSDLSGAYNFTDTAAGTNWWSVLTTPTPVGDYRSTALGGAGQTNPAPITSLNTTFAGQAPNGTWTLRITDGGGGDTGAVTAASLTITTSAPASAPVDMNGDGKTDYVTVRNTGGGPSGQVTWFTALNGGAQSGAAWGIATDFFVPEDYDGDNKSDIAVWRPGAATVAAFYILQSATSTVRIDTFGQTGDDPTVVGDYDGDGKSDVAVYRAGATAGAASTWYYRGSLTMANVSNRIWGQNGDFPAPGDYNGDGMNDFSIQRNNGGGQARFWTLLSTGVIDNSEVFGTPTDVIVPGDYDGDGKTDYATIRGVSGAIHWFYDPSSIAGIQVVTTIWGASATDFPTQGDYDGDGKTDQAIWRPNADPTQNFFWALQSGSGTVLTSEWGMNGDYPVANYNTH